MIGSYSQPKRNKRSSAVSSESPQIHEWGRPPEANATEPYSKRPNDCLQIRDRIRAATSVQKRVRNLDHKAEKAFGLVRITFQERKIEAGGDAGARETAERSKRRTNSKSLSSCSCRHFYHSDSKVEFSGRLLAVHRRCLHLWSSRS